MIDIRKLIFTGCVTGLLTLSGTATFASFVGCPDATDPSDNGCSLGGVVTGSQPYFVNDPVDVTYDGRKLDKKGYFKLKAKGQKGADAVLVIGGDTIILDKGKFNFKVKAGELDGDLLALGKVKLEGKTQEGEKLKVKADIGTKDIPGAWNVATDATGQLWGFDTTNLVCKSKGTLDGVCTTGEVVYLNVDGAIGWGTETEFEKVTGIGAAVTSVPVPTTALLFGSGLLGLIGIGRSRKNGLAS